MEYCFTGEGSDAVPAPTSLRGLDAGIYYRTGSLLNAGHAAVRTLVLDSLRHWAWEYDVDGFCFVNAENMVQGKHPPCKPDLWVSVKPWSYSPISCKSKVLAAVPPCAEGGLSALLMRVVLLKEGRRASLSSHA